MFTGFPGGSRVKESAYQCRRCRRHELDPWVRKTPWSRKWHPTPVFLLGSPVYRGAWWATAHGVTKGQAQLGTQACESEAYVSRNSEMHATLPFATYCELAKVKKVNVTVSARFRRTGIIKRCGWGE